MRSTMLPAAFLLLAAPVLLTAQSNREPAFYRLTRLEAGIVYRFSQGR